MNTITGSVYVAIAQTYIQSFQLGSHYIYFQR